MNFLITETFLFLCSAVHEEAEEDWGWEDNDDGGNAGGDLEMQPRREGSGSLSLHKDVTKRRTSGDNSLDDDFGWGSSSPRKSPSINSKTLGSSITNKAPQVPRLPTPPVPGASGLNIQPAPNSYPSTTITSSSHQSTSTPSSLSVPLTSPMAVIQPITTLGQKITKSPQKPATKQEDDIFASMGLAAKPTFSHNTPTRTVISSAPNSLGSAGRWTQTSDFVGTHTIGAISSTNQSTTTYNATASIGDDADNWDDDADLDDLLDD